jgi:hypothetical protein
MKSTDIELALLRLYPPRVNIVVPNVSWSLFQHECDMIVCRPSGYAIEIEIKVSVSDMKADLKKKHSHIDRRKRLRELYYAIPETIYEKCLPLIPENAGIIIIKRHEDKYTYHTNDLAIIKRRAIPVPDAVRLTEKEKLKLAHVGAMRIWNLKETIRNTSNKL